MGPALLLSRPNLQFLAMIKASATEASIVWALIEGAPSAPIALALQVFVENSRLAMLNFP